MTEKDSILVFNWKDIRHRDAGGAENYIQELSKRLIKKGHNIYIFTRGEPNLPSFELIDGVNIYRRGGFFTVYIWAFFYYIFIFRKKIDTLIDCHNGIPFFSPLYSRKNIILVLHHVHQEIFKIQKNPFIRELGIRMEKHGIPLVYKNKKAICVSEASLVDACNILKLPKKNISLVFNGIDHKKYSLGTKTSFPSIIYVGRLTAQKSIEHLLKGFAKVAKTVPEARLNIVGSGSQENILKELTHKLDIEGKTYFHGKIDEDKKLKLLRESWMLVYPSMHEGFGVTAIEASASGTPVIASRVKGLTEAVKEDISGFFYEYGDIKKLSELISHLIKNESERKRLSLGATEWAKEFDWDKSSKEFLKIIYGK